MLQQPAFFSLLALKVNISDPCKLSSELLLNTNLLHIVFHLPHELIDRNDGEKIACFKVSEKRKGNNDSRLILLIIRYQEVPNSISKLRGKSSE